MKIKVKIENQQYEVEIEDISARPVIAHVEGQAFEIWPEEEAAPRRPRPVVPAPPAAPSAESIARYHQRDGDRDDAGEAAVDGDVGVLREGLRFERDLLVADPEDGGLVGDRLVQHRRGGAADRSVRARAPCRPRRR